MGFRSWTEQFGKASATALIGAAALGTNASTASADVPIVDYVPLAGAVAAEEVAPVSDKISVSAGVDVSSHFISYGFDIWGGGTSWGKGTVWVWAEATADFDLFSVTAGAWTDNNKNATSAIGGSLQEVDVYVGISVPVDKFTLGVTYQEWIYAGQVEHIVDLSVGYDDTGMIAEDFALNPSFTAHIRTQGGGLDEGVAYVASVEPSFTLVESEEMPVSLSVPVSVAFGGGDFYNDGGVAFVSVGATVSMPLTFIPAEYGAWEAAFNLTYWHTDSSSIGNPDDDFVTGTFSLSVGLD